MCGIAGFVGSPDEKTVKKMTRSLVHRGPDEEGYFVNGSVALGMRRLRIIDLSGGKQPIYSRDKKSAIVFNGEIYNYKSLKTELEKLGQKFLTDSDTEVIMRGYEQWGVDVFNKLDGMFGLAIWNDKKKQLVLARDRFGEKPLYYGKFGSVFVFGSELKALLLYPAVKKNLNLEALSKYLTYDYVPAPLSIFKNIYKLEPGSYLTYPSHGLRPPFFARGEGNGGWTISKYWKIFFKGSKISFEEASQQLEQKLEQAVVSRMVSDVPLGVFLSGGLDSSSIAFFAQKNSKRKVKTFSIGFKDKSFDESDYAKKVAKLIGTEHSEHIFSAKDTRAVIPEIFEKLDEPFSDASILPTYLLSKFTREKVTVALDGDGSDELFGGYPTMQARKFLWLADLLPKFLVDALPTSFNNITWEYGLKRIALSRRYPNLYRDFVWINSFAPHEQEGVLSEGIREQLSFERIAAESKSKFSTNSNDNCFNPVFSDITRYLSEVHDDSDFNKIIYLYLKLYLQDNILTKSDRASMMVSLETRAPFLAVELAEFINSLPVKFKMRGLTTKYSLKRLMEKRLPKEIVYRKKKGFGVPLARWLTGDLKSLLQELLNPDKIKQDDYFNPDYVNQLIEEHLSYRKDNRKALWTLMAFQMWKEKWL